LLFVYINLNEKFLRIIMARITTWFLKENSNRKADRERAGASPACKNIEIFN